MAVNINGLRRNIKNVAHNYTDAQVKVREATSNDPWGPSSTMMSEIADLTYNVVAFTEIMQMVWKRLNDHGRNWRHVYKALVLLEYLIKTGSEKVAQQCKENIFAIQTLKDFQYLDDNKDQGINVREKAKSLVALLKDDERLKNERVRALKAKERFAQSAAGIGSDTVYNATRDRFEPQARMRGASPIEYSSSELEAARPQTAGEEELQLQLALAMSREEAEQEESKSKSDDMRLQLALQKSKEEAGGETAEFDSGKPAPKPSNGSKPAVVDLLDLDFGNPVAQPPPPTRTAASALGPSPTIDPWGMAVQPPPAITQNDPWGGVAAAALPHDPWSPVKDVAPRASPLPNIGRPSPINHQIPISENDPWSALPPASSASVGRSDAWSPVAASIDPFSPVAQRELTEFDMLRNQIESNKPGSPFEVGDLSSALPVTTPMASNTGTKPKKSVQSLLGEHSNLVNLDNLVTDSKAQVRNPFEQHPPNPFQAKATKPAMNQLLQQQSTPWQHDSSVQQSQQQQQDFNPFF